MLYAAQRGEQQPRRELIRNKTGHCETRRNTMNESFTKRARSTIRCSGGAAALWAVTPRLPPDSVVRQ
eukprot:8581363-Alexandrium_andersonii.AAC.1